MHVASNHGEGFKDSIDYGWKIQPETSKFYTCTINHSTPFTFLFLQLLFCFRKYDPSTDFWSFNVFLQVFTPNSLKSYWNNLDSFLNLAIVSYSVINCHHSSLTFFSSLLILNKVKHDWATMVENIQVLPSFRAFSFSILSGVAFLVMRNPRKLRYYFVFTALQYFHFF